MPGEVFISRNENVSSARRIRSARPPAFATQHLKCLERRLPDDLFRFRTDSGGTVVFRLIAEIFVLVVVVSLRRLDPDQRQRRVAENRRGQFPAVDKLFREHHRVMLCRQRVGGGQFLRRAHLGQADRRTLMDRLDDEGQSQCLHDGRPIRVLMQQHVLRHGDADCLAHQFGTPFVHRQRAGHDAAAGVRNTEHLQRALHRSVFP